LATGLDIGVEILVTKPDETTDAHERQLPTRYQLADHSWGTAETLAALVDVK
jgi:hypothetical protein